MKTILIVLLVVMGLYSCEKEPTSAIQVEKKYTLEEILADTNWVEIADTLHLEDKPYKGYTYLSVNWEMFTLIKFFNIDEYKNIEELSDTNSKWFIKGQLDLNLDFKKSTLLGLKTYKNSDKYDKLIYINEKLKICQYFIKIISNGASTRPNIHSYNFILIPKIESTYKLYGDTIQKWEN